MILKVKGETKGSVSSVAIIYKASLYNKKLKRKKIIKFSKKHQLF